MNKRERDNERNNERKRIRVASIIQSLPLANDMVLKMLVCHMHTENYHLQQKLEKERERIAKSNMWLCNECDQYTRCKNSEQCIWCDNEMCNICLSIHDCREQVCHICQKKIDGEKGICKYRFCKSDDLLCKECIEECDICGIGTCKDGCNELHRDECVKCGDCGKVLERNYTNNCKQCEKDFCSRCYIKCMCETCDKETTDEYQFFCKKICFVQHRLLWKKEYIK